MPEPGSVGGALRDYMKSGLKRRHVFRTSELPACGSGRGHVGYTAGTRDGAVAVAPTYVGDVYTNTYENGQATGIYIR